MERSMDDAALLVRSLRIGNGFDIHRFAESSDRPLVLGGVRFDGHPGLVGHSDGDAIAHACADAMLGAAGLGNIGQHFSDTDERWSGADSIELLAAVRQLVAESGLRVLNIDCSVVCESPKLSPATSEMQRRLSEAAGGPVTVKGRRAEGLGEIGAGRGLVVYASALLCQGPDRSEVN
jgi:2-C-methyl-D-erythritol 2,4-cyclodiphosphate synthase